MKTLREVLADADARRVAVGHFNISELAALKGIFAAAQELNLPILIGVSEGEREFIGVKQASALIKILRENYDFPIFLNADHTHVLDKAKEAAEAGFDEVLFDGSAFPLDDNIRRTQEAVKAIRAINPSIVIEGEIGYIGSSSEIVDKRPEASLQLSTPEEAIRFVNETGVDVLAPAVGNMHGLLANMVTGAEHKHLDIARIAEIKKACGKFMTLHGGSGTEDTDFTAAAKNGMTIIHVSSELRLAWRRGVEAGLAANPNEIAPYKLLPPAVEGIKKIVEDRLKLFNGLR
ncbi:MAG TPA: class II fructose-bisphosphate aldolase [Candidatus Paceibacterota bacterium]|jgi:fructose-bisphosphate aldolase class II|nr:class II fructose-bisphosphate aldolase [Candidatus Paceibacterota bacterium]